MRVYILGPMRGHKYYNFAAFGDMATELRKDGHDVVSPAEIELNEGRNPYTFPEGFDWNQYPTGANPEDIIKRDINAILTCNAYVALDGWEKSTGAKAEKGVLDWMGACRLMKDELFGGFCGYAEPTAVHPDWKTAAYLGVQDNMNPKDKLGMKKPPLHLIPASALIYLSVVMKLGATKYGPGNWREHPVKMTVYLSAAWRHILEALDGLDKDDESGMPPMAHAMACCAIILDALACGCLIDDRPPKGAAHKLIAELTEKDEPNFASVKNAVAEMDKALQTIPAGKSWLA